MSHGRAVRRLRGLRARAKLVEMFAGSRLLALMLVAAGCTAHSSEPTPAASAEHLCRVQIVRVGPPAPSYEGSGEGDSTQAALDAARRDACTRVPADQREACHDPGRFGSREKSTRTSFTITNGKAAQSHTATLTLVETSAEATAEARSVHHLDDACERARIAACENAGAGGRCFDSSAYRVGWESRGPRLTFE